MFFLLYWTLKVIGYFLMALYLAAFLAGLIMWTIARVAVRLLLALVLHLLGRRPAAQVDDLHRDRVGAAEGEDVPVQVSPLLDQEFTPALRAYLVGRH